MQPIPTLPPKPRSIGDRLLRVAWLALSAMGRPAQKLVLRLGFEGKYRTPDPWNYSTSQYERQRMAEIMAAPGPGPFATCLEIACSEGVFTEMLAGDPRIGRITAMDISPRAVERARERLEGHASDLQFFVGDLSSENFGGRYDLIFCTEVLYYLGIARGEAARRLIEALAPGGLLVLAHADPEASQLHRPFTGSRLTHLRSTRVVSHPTRPVRITVVERLPAPVGTAEQA